jgi:Fe-S-cluster-containing dehydrogenase component
MGAAREEERKMNYTKEQRKEIAGRWMGFEGVQIRMIVEDCANLEAEVARLRTENAALKICVTCEEVDCIENCPNLAAWKENT